MAEENEQPLLPLPLTSGRHIKEVHNKPQVLCPETSCVCVLLCPYLF